MDHTLIELHTAAGWAYHLPNHAHSDQRIWGYPQISTSTPPYLYKTGLIVTFGRRLLDRHKEPCGQSNSVVSGHMVTAHTGCLGHMLYSTGSGQWLVVTNVMLL